MKKKIFNIILLLILTIAMLFTLTACGNDSDDEKDEKSSSKSATPEDVIEAAVQAVNNQEVDDLIDLIDLDSLEELYGETIKKKELKEGLKSFFDENDDFEVKLSKIQSLEDDDDLLDDLLDDYDSYDEYVEEVADEFGLEDDVYIYTAKAKLSGENYEDLMDFEEDDSEFKGKDIIFLTKKDKEYKIVYTRLAIVVYSDYALGYDDYDDDDYDYDDYDDDIDVSVFNSNFEDYEGKQLGTNINSLVDAIIKNQTDDHPVYISYYGEDGYIDEIMINEEDDLKAFKEKIAEKHYYTVESEEDYEGYIRYIDIKY